MKNIFLQSLIIAISMFSANAKDLFADGNIIANSSFEKRTILTEQSLLKKYADKGAIIPDNNWVEGWTINPSCISPGKYEIINDENAPDGKTYLHVEIPQSSHIYTQGGIAGVKYRWSIWIKALPEVNGKTVRPYLSLSYYKYGPRDDQNKQVVYKGAGRIKVFNLVKDGKWRKYQGEFILPAANFISKFALFLGVKGNVSIDGCYLKKKHSSKVKVLLHLPFDNNFKTTTKTVSKYKTRGRINFVKGVKGKAAVFKDGAYLEYDAADIFNQDEGTVSFWFNPQNSWNDEQAHCLFEVPVLPYKFLDSGLCISKGFTDRISPNLFYFTNCPPWKDIHMSAEGIWRKNSWNHLICTWSKSQSKMQIYLNGIMFAEKDVRMKSRPSAKDRKIIIGARQIGKTPQISENWNRESGNKIRNLTAKNNFSANAAIDELYILDKAVSAQQAWKLFGGKGEVPSTKNKKMSPKEFTELTYDLKTPCIQFARPLAGKKLRALFLVPIHQARDVVELKQIMDIDCDTYLFSSFFRNPFYAHRRAKKFHYGCSDKDMIKLLHNKLDKKPDIIVLVNTEWRFMPGDIIKKIQSMVKNGTSLLMTSRAINKSMFSRVDNKAATEICNGIPWKGLPEMFFDSKDVPRNIIPKHAVSTGYYNKGRVASIKFNSSPIKREGYLYSEAGLTPCLYKIGYSPSWKYRYGRYLSLTAKALFWLGKKHSSWEIELPKDGKIVNIDPPKTTTLHCKALGNGAGSIDIKIRNEMGKIELSKIYKITDASTCSIELPSLKTGLYYLDAIVKANDKVLQWASSSFTVKSKSEIKNISLGKDFYAIEDNISGKIVLEKTVSEQYDILLELKDMNGRIYEQVVKKVEPGQKSIDFSMPIDTPLTRSNFVTAKLRNKDFVISSCKRHFLVDLKRNVADNNSDIFPSIIWWGWENLPQAMIYAEQLKKAGFNTALTWPKGHKLHNLSMWRLLPFNYMTHLRMEVASDGKGTEGGSWALPTVKESKWEGIKNYLGNSKKYSPLVYSLGDEDIYRGEFGYSQASLEFYRNFLKQKYGTIKELNNTWQSNYADFSKVPRFTVSEAGQQNNCPALIDHREAQEAVWREMFIYLREKIKAYDSNAIVGAEGSETHDIEKMLAAMDFWGPYSNIRSNVFLRQSKKIRGQWYGGYCESRAVPYSGLCQIWEQMFKGFSNVSLYFIAGPSSMGDGLLKPDGSYSDYFKNTQLEDMKLLVNGLGQLLRKNSIVKPAIILHWSRRSRIVGEIDKKYGRTNQCDGRIISLLNKLNIVNWGYMTETQLCEKNIPQTVKAFILPLTQCLSIKEVKKLENFVKKGGALIAVGPAGIRNSLGKKLPASPISKLLGIKLNAPYAVKKISNFSCAANINNKNISIKGARNLLVSSVGINGAKCLAKYKNIPLLTRNSFGQGTAYFINSDISKLDIVSAKNMFEALISSSRFSHPVNFIPSPGPGEHWGLLEANDMKLLGVILEPDGWNKGNIILPEKQHVYDVMKGRYLGYIKQIKAEGRTDRKTAVLYALQAAPIQGLAITIPDKIKLNTPVTISCSVKTDKKLSCLGRVVKIQFKSPDNKIVSHYQKMFYTNHKGNCSKTIEFALNDQPGIWTVIATDVASGVNETVNLKIIP